MSASGEEGPAENFKEDDHRRLLVPLVPLEVTRFQIPCPDRVGWIHENEGQKSPSGGVFEGSVKYCKNH